MHARWSPLALAAIMACGGSAPPAAAPPAKPPPFESLTGAGPVDRDKQIVRRHLKTRDAEIRGCYEQALVANPGLAGRVEVVFVIDLDGHVRDAHATGMDDAPTVAPCVADQVSQIQFPRPANGVVNVTFPFTFSATPTPPR